MVWGVGGEVVTKFLQHLCMSKDELPVKHSEKMLSLTVMSFQENIRDFVRMLCCFIYHTEVSLYVWMIYDFINLGNRVLVKVIVVSCLRNSVE
jgi:hypothetical protein